MEERRREMGGEQRGKEEGQGRGVEGKGEGKEGEGKARKEKARKGKQKQKHMGTRDGTRVAECWPSK